MGYVRVSSADQNTARQVLDREGGERRDGLNPGARTVDRLFTDHATGSDTDRPELQAMLTYVRSGDTVLVHSMDRLARNLNDLRRIVDNLTDRGVYVQFIKENLTFTGEDSPMSNLLLSMLGAVAQFERDLLRERQREGIALAKQRGAYRGRKPRLTLAQAREIERRIAAGERPTALMREYQIVKTTLYRYLRGVAQGLEHPHQA